MILIPGDRDVLIGPSCERCPTERFEYDYHSDQALLLPSMSERLSWEAKIMGPSISILKCIEGLTVLYINLQK